MTADCTWNENNKGYQNYVYVMEHYQHINNKIPQKYPGKMCTNIYSLNQERSNTNLINCAKYM